METKCCVSGCSSTSQTIPKKCFYAFPLDINLCILWVQNCGVTEYFEDFAYRGVLPFRDRRICSDHFHTTDFVDSKDVFSGLKPNTIPTTNFVITDIIKQEPDEEDDDTQKPQITLSESDREFMGNVKVESTETDTSEDDIHRGQIQSMHNELLYQNNTGQSTLPVMIISKDKILWKKKAKAMRSTNNVFKSVWIRALRTTEEREARDAALKDSFGNSEDEEDKKLKNAEKALRVARKRECESEQERRDRLYKNAVRAALRRSLETEEQQKERRMKNAMRASMRRAMETPEQREDRRKKDLVRSANRRKQESEMQAKIRRYNDAVRAAFRRSNETEEQKQQRRMVDVLRAARRRSMETPEQRTARLQADRERAAKRRILKKIAEVGNFSPDLFKGRISQFEPENIITSFKTETRIDPNMDGCTESFVVCNSAKLSAGSEANTSFSNPLSDFQKVTTINSSEEETIGILKPEVVWCT